MTDIEIMKKFDEKVKANGFEYKRADVLFYLKLFRYIEKEGKFNEEMGMHYVQLSIEGFANVLDCSLGLAGKQIKQLEKFGVIKRVKGEIIRDRYGLFEAYLTYISLDI